MTVQNAVKVAATVARNVAIAESAANASSVKNVETHVPMVVKIAATAQNAWRVLLVGLVLPV